MRKGFCILLLAGVCTICSCGKAQPCVPADIEDSYTANAVITQGEDKFTADISRAGAGLWSFTFTSPETVEGMEITTDNDNCKVDFKDLTYTITRENFPQCSVISLCSAAVDTMSAKRDIFCEMRDGKLVEMGSVDGQEFTAYFSDNKLEEIQFPDNLNIKLD